MTVQSNEPPDNAATVADNSVGRPSTRPWKLGCFDVVFASWNARGFSGQSSPDTLLMVMRHHKVDICFMQELRMTPTSLATFNERVKEEFVLVCPPLELRTQHNTGYLVRSTTQLTVVPSADRSWR